MTDTNQTPYQRIAELNRRLQAGEDVSDEEIKEGIQLLRDDRAAKTKGKQQAAASKEKQEALGEDVLTNLI